MQVSRSGKVNILDFVFNQNEKCENFSEKRGKELLTH